MDYWKGRDYELPTNRILILGESTYDTDGVADAPLQQYVQQWLDRIETRDHTFARICNACSGNPESSATKEGRSAFWSTVAFYNFVVDRMGSSTTRPMRAQFESSKSALAEVLNVLKPDGVWILGRETASYAEEVAKQSGVVYLSVDHPASRGLKNEVLTASWNSLLGMVSERHQ